VTDDQTTMCPGCGLRLPESGVPLDVELNASSECWRRYLDATGFELSHVAALGGFHQLLVDTYGAQHPGPPSKPIRLVYSLVGLHLALEQGFNGLEVRQVHQRMGKPRADWPVFARPAHLGLLTVDALARAGADAESVEGHARALREWAADVWRAWSSEHEAVRAFAGTLRTPRRR
jgi:hypothetical protein